MNDTYVLVIAVMAMLGSLLLISCDLNRLRQRVAKLEAERHVAPLEEP